MSRVLLSCLLFLSIWVSGCPKRSDVPESAYDPEILDTAKKAIAESKAQQPVTTEETPADNAKGECDHQSGGCKKGYVCWDSRFCKSGFTDQCAESGDKRCHRSCSQDGDCPAEMPTCRDISVFKGNEVGTLEKFCVGE